MNTAVLFGGQVHWVRSWVSSLKGTLPLLITVSDIGHVYDAVYVFILAAQALYHVQKQLLQHFHINPYIEFFRWEPRTLLQMCNDTGHCTHRESGLMHSHAVHELTVTRDCSQKSSWLTRNALCMFKAFENLQQQMQLFFYSYLWSQKGFWNCVFINS